MKELFFLSLVIDGIEKSLSLQDSNGHHLLDFVHVLLEDMLVELIDLVVSFLLKGFWCVECLRTKWIQAKTVWVEVKLSSFVLQVLLFIFHGLVDEEWSLQINKLLVIDLEISKLFVADALELGRQNDIFDFFVLI